MSSYLRKELDNQKVNCEYGVYEKKEEKNFDLEILEEKEPILLD